MVYIVTLVVEVATGDSDVSQRNDDLGRKMESPAEAIGRKITGYHVDEEGHWVAQLDCGHNQHVRHDPPLVSRRWVRTDEGRQSMLGYVLQCKKCVESAPPDERPE